MPNETARTVLLVDDDDAILTLLKHAFRTVKWNVHSATNGLDALEQHEQHLANIDLLVTDLQMPEMNGADLALRVREIRPGLPILFISGESGTALTAAIASMTNTRRLNKPFMVTDFIATVQSLVAS